MTNEFVPVSGFAVRGPKVSFERERGVYAIQVTRDVAHALAPVGDDAQRSGRILQIFRTLADAGIPIFLIKMHHTAVSFALAGEDVARADQALLAAGFKPRTRRDLAMIVMLAAAMREVSGIMVDIGDALHTAGAHLYATGDSHDSVQCLIEAERLDAVTAALCDTFTLNQSAVQECPLETESDI